MISKPRGWLTKPNKLQIKNINFPNSVSEHQHSSWASNLRATKWPGESQESQGRKPWWGNPASSPATSSTARPSTRRPLTRPAGRAPGSGPAAQGGAHPTEDPAPPIKGTTRGEERESESGTQHSSSTWHSVTLILQCTYSIAEWRTLVSSAIFI